MPRKRSKIKINEFAKRGGNSLLKVAGAMGGNFAINLIEDNVPFARRPGMPAGLLYLSTLLANVFLPIKANSIGANLITGAEVVSGVEAVNTLIGMGTRVTGDVEIEGKTKSDTDQQESYV